MARRTTAYAAAGLLALSLLASACGGTQTPTTSTNPSGGGSTAAVAASDPNGAMSMRGCTPQNPLIAANTAEVCGGDILDVVNARLVKYNPKDASPENNIAQSIETTDNTNFTVKIRPGYMFQDNTEVKSANFVDAWNFAAYGPNGNEGSYFFSVIDGYGDVTCDTGANKNCVPKSKTLSGLKVVDDHTFTIKTSEPVSNLPVRLGYNAFAPMPDSFLKDADPKHVAFGKMPVGSGPFKVVANTEQEITLERFDAYSGTDKPKLKTVHYKIYNEVAAAYNDVVANQLDFTNSIPLDQLAGDLWKTDLPGRNDTKASSLLQYIAFSPVDEQLKSTDKRKAISMAIDRKAITTAIFQNSRTPATSWVSPIVNGYKENSCGETCTYDPAKAKQLWDAAGGYKGTLTITVNNDGGHKPWADAVCNQLHKNLGVDCVVQLKPKFSVLLDELKARKVTGLFRYGWQMDYPSIENYLTPIYAKGAGSNYTDYYSADFEKTLKDAAAAKTVDEANALYQKAESYLAKDLPTIPTWVSSQPVAWSTNIDNVVITPFGVIDLTQVTVKVKK